MGETGAANLELTADVREGVGSFVRLAFHEGPIYRSVEYTRALHKDVVDAAETGPGWEQELPLPLDAVRLWLENEHAIEVAGLPAGSTPQRLHVWRKSVLDLSA